MEYASSEYDTDPYESLRSVLDPVYADLPPEDIEAIVETAFPGVSAEELEGWLSDIAKKAMPVVSQVLPAALPVVGTMVGGPVGTMIGGVAGKAVGSLLKPGTTKPPATGQVPTTAAPAGAASPATAQLLQTMLRPEMLQALFAMLMGQSGQKQINVGGQPVPPAAFANLLGSLAANAAAEYNSLIQRPIPDYLMDDAGDFIIDDPASPEQRADALLALLNSVVGEYESEEDWSDDAGWDEELIGNQLSSIDAYYDALDVIQAVWEQEMLLETWDE